MTVRRGIEEEWTMRLILEIRTHIYICPWFLRIKFVVMKVDLLAL